MLLCADLPDPWSDRDALAAAARDCRLARERLLVPLAEFLDRRHGSSLGPSYWRVVLGPWLLYHLQQLEDRRRRAEAALRPKSKKLTVLDEADFEIPRDSPDFLALFQTERYNQQLLALAFRALGADVTTARLDKERTAPEAPAPALRRLFRSARGAVHGAGRRLFRSELLSDGIYPLGRRHEQLAKELGFRLWPITGELPARLRVPGVMDDRRRSLASLPASGPLESLAVASLPWCLPSLFLEGFPAARAHARRALGTPPRAMLHSSGIYYNDLYKLCAAEAALSGTRLVGVQHGGQYGTALWSNAEWHERSIADAYFTWGWSEDEKTVPLPMPWLSFPPPRTPTTGEVLLISTTGLKIPHELFPFPMGRQWEDFMGWRERFIAGLEDSDRAALRTRLFPTDCGWNERARLEARFPGLRFDSDPFTESLSKAALVVTDHPATVFLETLAWDIPGVHFWDDAVWSSRPTAQTALEPLRRAGIVHGTPEAAAAKIAQVRSDPDSWWNAPQTREARREFVHTYARHDPAWASEWAATLRRIGTN